MRDSRLVKSGPAEQLCITPECAYTKRLLAAASGLAYPEPDSQDDRRELLRHAPSHDGR